MGDQGRGVSKSVKSLHFSLFNINYSKDENLYVKSQNLHEERLPLR